MQPSEYMEELKLDSVICCEARIWANVIAWIQIVLNLIGIIGAASDFIRTGCLLIENGAFDHQHDYTRFGILLAVFIVQAMFGGLLYEGVRQMRVSFLKLWTHWMLLWMFVEVFLSGMLFCAEPTFAIVTLVILLPVLMFCINVVRTLILEIQFNRVLAQFEIRPLQLPSRPQSLQDEVKANHNRLMESPPPPSYHYSLVLVV